MGNNSIRSNLSKEDIISDLRMTYCTNKKSETVTIIVEGIDDIEFFKGRCNDNVEFVESFSGRHGVFEILECFSIPNIIAVCDRDYTAESANNIFYYDSINLEIMMLKCDDLFERIYNNYYYGDLDLYNFKKLLFFGIRWLSVFREQNDLNKWEISFKDFPLSTVIDKNFYIKIEQALTILSSKNKKRDLSLENSVVESRIKLLDKMSFLYEEITQGHDVVAFFQHICSEFNDNTPSKKEIARIIRCSYSKENFRQTELYNSLNAHSLLNNLPLICK